MNPALTAILDAIEAGTVRIRWAHDDEHAQQEAEHLLDDARTLLGMLNERVPAHTEADAMPDPYEVAERMAAPRRNCLTCQHDEGAQCTVNLTIGSWGIDNCDHRGRPKPDADNCPGYMLRESASRITVGK